MKKVYVSRKIMRYLSEIPKIIKQLAIPCRAIGKSRLSVYTFFIVLAVVLVLSPLPSFARQWEVFCEGNHTTWYYDSSSVKFLPGNKVQVLAKIVPDDQGAALFAEIMVPACQSSNKQYKNAQGEFSHEEDLYEFNCKTDEQRTISITYYDKDGKILCKDAIRGRAWSKIDASSCHRLLYQKLLALLFGGKK